VPADSDSGCGILDKNDRCPLPGMARDSEVRVGPSPGGRAIGTITRGTEVREIERREGYAAIALVEGEIEPPGGARFWVRAQDVGTSARSDGGDGCPEPN
jgi:hypothetical protein